MIHPATEVRPVSEHIGYGVFARERILKGTITWVRCALDRVFTPAEVEALGPSYWPLIDRYTYRDGRDQYILNWDHAKFMNHSCEPTVLCPGWDFDVALRDLEPGDELTYDYAVLNLDEVLQCSCGCLSCRGVVSRADIDRLADVWDAQIASSIRLLESVEQPLWPFVAHSNQVLAAARGQIPVPSVRLHFAAHPESTLPRRAS